MNGLGMFCFNTYILSRYLFQKESCLIICFKDGSSYRKWGGQEYSVTTLSEDDTVLDLKQFLKTPGVLPERLKGYLASKLKVIFSSF